jgi:hypothetical protein
LGEVVIARHKFPGVGRGTAVTLAPVIYWPPGFAVRLPWLIHELTHVWQARQWGWRAVWDALTRRSYRYGGTRELLRRRAAGGTLQSFSAEQQGDILEDFYRALRAGRDVTAFLPYVEEVRQGRAARALGEGEGEGAEVGRRPEGTPAPEDEERRHDPHA